MNAKRLLPLLLILAGCGGDHPVSSPSSDGLALGAASIELTVGGTHAPGPMVGTGTAQGEVSFSPSGGTTSVFRVYATLLGASKGKAGTDREVELGLATTGDLVAGQTFAVGSAVTFVYCTEIARASSDDDLAVPEDWVVASGTVTVESVGNGVATVRLRDVVCPGATGSDSSAQQVTLSGTITGPIVVGNAA